ncbi:MAG: bifunctional 4-hydroxy-2-oxoglutarate aldolase/2-dehydro-3-deoxy-phosphogluconate aldolase [Rhodoglobus sp.]
MTVSMDSVAHAVREQKIVAIVRSKSQDEAQTVVGKLVAAGLRTIEVSLVTPGAIEVIRRAAATAPDGVNIGVGTALSVDDVTRAAKAGARFVVAPTLREDVIRSSLDLGLVTFPGVATPTEAMQAVEWGSPFVKLFPASLWTPRVMKDMLTALTALQIVPTGGVDLSNAAEWIRAGAVALGIGSTLTSASDPSAVVRELTAAIQSV